MAFSGKAYYITRIENLPSILERGILSFNRCRGNRVKHESFALPTIQDKRERKSVPNGRPLHDYACLYLHARNPAMFLLSKMDPHFGRLCVLVLDAASILEIPDVVISDMNAASKFAHFYGGHEIDRLDFNRIYARYWTHADQQDEWLHKYQKCAEVLVPDGVSPTHFIGIFVQDEDSNQEILANGCQLKTKVNPELFFRSGNI